MASAEGLILWRRMLSVCAFAPVSHCVHGQCTHDQFMPAQCMCARGTVLCVRTHDSSGTLIGCQSVPNLCPQHCRTIMYVTCVAGLYCLCFHYCVYLCAHFCVQFVSNLCPVGVQLVSNLCPVCVRFVSGLCPVCVRFVSSLCPVCIRFVSGFKGTS